MFIKIQIWIHTQLYIFYSVFYRTNSATNQIQRAAVLGCPDAQNEYGIKLLNGDGVNKNYYEAQRQFNKSANQGNIFAVANLGHMHLEGLYFKKDYQQAFNYYSISAKKQHPQSLYNLGWFYENGLGVEKNIELAIKNYVLASKFGLSSAKKALEEIET